MEQVVRAQTVALPRYGHVLASTMRFGPLRGIGPSFKKLGQSGFRVLILHVSYSPLSIVSRAATLALFPL
jgi:hypothetical protein